MPKFAISWKKLYSNEWSNPEEFQTGSGMLVIEADSPSAVQEEIRKYEGKECALDERVVIDEVAVYEGPEQGLPLATIHQLMDPWASLATAY